jgi:hypothetical protein
VATLPGRAGVIPTEGARGARGALNPRRRLNVELNDNVYACAQCSIVAARARQSRMPLHPPARTSLQLANTGLAHASSPALQDCVKLPRPMVGGLRAAATGGVGGGWTVEKLYERSAAPHPMPANTVDGDGGGGPQQVVCEWS